MYRIRNLLCKARFVTSPQIPGSRVGIVGEIRLTPSWHSPLKMWLLYHLVRLLDA